jgi:transcriptional regulator with XRE-family HTH domain
MSSRQTVIKVGPSDTTLRARLLGARLREKREAAGLKLVAAATLNKRQPSTLSRWETGERLPHPSELFYAMEVYGVRGAERDELMRIVQEAHDQPDAPNIVSTAVADYDWLERSAHKLDGFWDTALPGLLQTDDYAREILRAWDPAVGRERLEQTLTARMARTERLAGEDALEVCAVVGEGALRAVVAGPEAMRAQLRHLLDCAVLPRVELRVVPFTAGAHPGIAGRFTILRFHEGRALAHLITRAGDIYLEDTEPFTQALRRIRRAALSPRESISMIASITKAMT